MKDSLCDCHVECKSVCVGRSKSSEYCPFLTTNVTVNLTSTYKRVWVYVFFLNRALCHRLRLKCVGTCAETRLRLYAKWTSQFNPLNAELNPICYLLALLGAHHFLHVSRIRVKLLTFRLLMSYIYGAPILDVSRSHTTTQHSR